MVPSLPALREEPLTLIFGPQILGFDEALAAELRSTLLASPDLSWILDAVLQLPQHWDSVSRAIPLLQQFNGHHHLQSLSAWLTLGEFPKDSLPLPNIILTPLVVITHFAQYSTFLDQTHPDIPSQHRLQSRFRHRAETLGLCTGLLSAAAVSCSANRSQLEAYGSVAIRLAMVIGAFVDAKDTETDSEGMWRSASVRWASKEMGESVDQILHDFPKTYVSVLSEERIATVTTMKANASALWRKLNDAGATVADIALRGAFHCGAFRREYESLITFLNKNPEFQYSDVNHMVFPALTSSKNGYLATDKLHREVTLAMLADQGNWHESFTALEASEKNSRSTIVSFGSERFIPQWLRRRLGSRFIQASDLCPTRVKPSVCSIINTSTEVANEAVAVVGMSCHLPGGKDVEEFWEILCQAKSQHIEVPAHRFEFQSPWREKDPRRKWFGNFVADHDSFDHKFFQSNPREASSTDPQQRLMLQVAYQAVEQSGYLNMPLSDKHIGCYIGVGLADYEGNVACHTPTAYTATGNLKAFTAGKISHYFGWTGPGVTIDTACSSSFVAIHQACKAILSGECSAALAGGVNIMTSPEWFENLAGASFLSSTGQCKPFDSNADGYCRGEGVGAVFLKKLSTAIEDGNNILGIISATGVYQNQNCTAITVPNSRSLSDLFTTVTRKAGLEPTQITVVEAHGTGTQVGDPAEYESVRKVFGGPQRSDLLSLGSVKGLVGHTESASGIVALIKVLLMIHHGVIPPQASFQNINPALDARPSDNIEICRALRAWNVPFRAALINNYGASGSNASLVVTQGPKLQVEVPLNGLLDEKPYYKYPLWLCGHDDQSIRRYSATLLDFIRSKSKSNHPLDLRSLSFHLSRQSNRNLARCLIFSCSSMNELEEKLSIFSDGQDDLPSKPCEKSPRPVILCFGGQISTFIGLDKDVYRQMRLLRYHLDQCNEMCLSLRLDSIYPDIFNRTPIQDIVKLQTMLFALQYSCARSWIESGVEIAAVVGHSFGELTAMCISGVLSLKDAMNIIARRARIIRDVWGPEKGAMMAVEADEEDVKRLLSEVQTANPTVTGATIACFNAPRLFTLAGSVEAIGLVDKTVSSNQAFASIKTKRLDVTHAFHSTLVEPLLSDLRAVGQGIVFRDQTIPWERAVKSEITAKITPAFGASHMRNPVYFGHAVQRLSERYPSAIWLEAGSNSTITNLASRAVGSPKSSHFQSVNLANNSGINSLVDVTTNLWKEGLKVSFWAHHPVHALEFDALMLPPYQFGKSKHWLPLKKPQKAIDVSAAPQLVEQPKELFTLVDRQGRSAHFRVNTSNEKYKAYVSAHVIAQTSPLCPSTFQLVIAIEALATLMADPNLQPHLQGMDSHAPMVMDSSRTCWLTFEQLNNDDLLWDWKITSTNTDSDTRDATAHVSGRIALIRNDNAIYQKDFARYERLVDRRRCQALLDGNGAESIIQGSRNIYKAFAETVQYKHELYRSLQKLAGNDNESAGRIMADHRGETLLDLGLADNFCQVAGIFLNTMTDLEEDDIFISDRIDQWIPSPGAWREPRKKHWEVYARHHRVSDKEHISDVFVFDPVSGRLLEVILGIHYVKVPRARMAKMLTRLAPSSVSSSSHPPSFSHETVLTNRLPNGVADESTILASPPSLRKEKRQTKESPHPDVFDGASKLLGTLLGLEPEEIRPDIDLVDLGIDSLMAMEVTREIENFFKIALDMTDVMQLTDFKSLVKCIQNTLGSHDDVVGEEDDQAEGQAETTASGIQPLTNGAAADVNGVNGHGSHTTCITPHINGANGIHPHVNGRTKLSTEEDGIPAPVIVDTFIRTKGMTDKYIEESNLSNYVHHVLPKLNELCVVHIADAFDELGCSLRKARSGDVVNRIEHLPKHEQFVAFIYELLETAKLIDIDGDKIIRKSIPVPAKSAETLLQELLKEHPVHGFDHRLTYLTGRKLADCLTGKADGIQLIFSDPAGKEVVAGMYAHSPINVAWLQQMMDFLKGLFLNLPKQSGPINILELGAGTGGTTAKLVSLLASLGVPFRYTVTDLSSSLVAGARKRFKEYPFMQFKVLDIEKPPSAEFLNSQHLVIATNCVHATHDLAKSTKNIHQLMRPDGFLMMLEMTQTIPWIDLVFGLLEGWWLFNDGRRHALAPPEVWENTLRANGYGHVDWTDGNLPEAAIQRVIIALASGPKFSRVFTPPKPLPNASANLAARQAVVDSFVRKHTESFSSPVTSIIDGTPVIPGQYVLVTGATGSLGSHLVAYFASQPDVQHVICLNRHSTIECSARQIQALESRGLNLSKRELRKLKVLGTDSSKPNLGLSVMEYTKIVNTITHIVHNAWPMSVTRPIHAFQPQFQTMQNLILLAREASCRRPHHAPKIGFQFISSIATVGHHPLLSGQPLVSEERVGVDSVLPSGYGEAKLVCERMLDETLHKCPDFFRPMAVRIGQIAGSKTSGYWNPVEHFAFMLKSSQTLKALPDLGGELSWCPVNDVAASLGELLLGEATPYPIYHIENPIRQSWQEMISVIAKWLGVPRAGIIPFDLWLRRVRDFPPSLAASENPAAMLADFLETHFERMSCGGLILDTSHTVEHSKTLRNSGMVTEDLVKKYIDTWKSMGFLRT